MNKVGLVAAYTAFVCWCILLVFGIAFVLGVGFLFVWGFMH